MLCRRNEIRSDSRVVASSKTSSFFGLGRRYRHRGLLTHISCFRLSELTLCKNQAFLLLRVAVPVVPQKSMSIYP
jgi:hypothetical protein